jgi:hypothetical protein
MGEVSEIYIQFTADARNAGDLFAIALRKTETGTTGKPPFCTESANRGP